MPTNSPASAPSNDPQFPTPAAPPSPPPKAGRREHRPAPSRRTPAAGDATMQPPSTRTTRLRLLVIATLSLLLAQTLASSSATAVAAAEPADPCAVAVSDGGSEGASCPVRCFRPDPVCGADGVTYWCGCPEAACAGARVARRGYCEVGAGSAPVSGQALLLVHIVWLFVLGAAVLLGFL